MPNVTGPGLHRGQANVRTLGPGQWPQPMKPAAASLDEDVYDAKCKDLGEGESETECKALTSAKANSHSHQ